jgi:hypothetical protein
MHLQIGNEGICRAEQPAEAETPIAVIGAANRTVSRAARPVKSHAWMESTVLVKGAPPPKSSELFA